MATETVPPENPAVPKMEIRTGARPSVHNKAAILAELDDEAPTPVAAKPVVEKKPPLAEEKTDEQAETDEEAPKIEAKDEKPDDPDDKALARIKAQESRMRADVAKEKAELERDRAAWKAEQRKVEQTVEQIQKLGARAKYDPAALLRAFGVSDDDFADVSRLIYSESPEFAKDPKNKEAAAKFARDKEYTDKVRALEEKQRKFEEQREAEKKEQETKEQLAEYVDGVVKGGVSADATPRVQKLLDKSPRVARADLQQIAEIMAHEGGDISPKSVAAMFERVLEQEAEEYGYESAKPKIEPAKVEKKAATATVPTNGRAVAKPGARTTRSELLAKIEADDLT